MDGLKLATLDTLQHRLTRDAESTDRLTHRQEPFSSFTGIGSAVAVPQQVVPQPRDFYGPTGHARGHAAPSRAEGAQIGQEGLYQTAPPADTIALATPDGDEVINCTV